MSLTKHERMTLLDQFTHHRGELGDACRSALAVDDELSQACRVVARMRAERDEVETLLDLALAWGFAQCEALRVEVADLRERLDDEDTDRARERRSYEAALALERKGHADDVRRYAAMVADLGEKLRDAKADAAQAREAARVSTDHAALELRDAIGERREALEDLASAKSDAEELRVEFVKVSTALADLRTAFRLTLPILKDVAIGKDPAGYALPVLRVLERIASPLVEVVAAAPKTVEVTFAIRETCSRCDGKGKLEPWGDSDRDASDVRTCSRCGGTGTTVRS